MLADSAPVSNDGESPADRLARMLTERTLPRLVSEGTFGPGWILQAAKASPIGGFGEDHWASTTLSTTLDLEHEDNRQARRVALVSKCMIPSELFDGPSVPEVQASNETSMYNVVFPFFAKLADGSGVQVTDLHPKCYLGEVNTEGLLSLTVMQDLRADGFSLSKKRTDLDMQHAKLALRAVGRLHALSHAAKARRRDEFLASVVPLLREPNYLPSKRDPWGLLMRLPFMRGVRRLSARLQAEAPKDAAEAELHRHSQAALCRLEAVSEDVYGFMERVATAQEPDSVVVHGDFCRNNMQYHYDVDGQPTRVCLFDFQNSRYCSPSVDLSFFIFCCVSAELIKTHWNTLLQEYWNSLEETLDKLLEGHEVHQDFVRPTLQGIREDLKKHALWGYTICAFFLPMMMVPPEDLTPIEVVLEMAKTNEDAVNEMILNVGGDRASDALADLLLIFVEKDLIP